MHARKVTSARYFNGIMMITRSLSFQLIVILIPIGMNLILEKTFVWLANVNGEWMWFSVYLSGFALIHQSKQWIGLCWNRRILTNDVSEYKAVCFGCVLQSWQSSLGIAMMVRNMYKLHFLWRVLSQRWVSLEWSLSLPDGKDLFHQKMRCFDPNEGNKLNCFYC